MNKYYFTFNSQHFTKEGYSLENHFVSVEALSWEQARSLFLNHFMAKEMNCLTDFSYQYDAVDFVRMEPHYPAGEFRRLILLDLNEVE